ncbi:hypothetical protein J7F03_11950 [Streptomyces sp. ISL-43]|nr:hypothetical protein [Streptomyces sp. ISL-43]
MQAEELVPAVAPLDGDVDVAVAGEVRAGAAGAARKIDGFDPNLHEVILLGRRAWDQGL